MAKFLIDPGHGGKDPGAVLGSRQEADDVLKLALDVGKILVYNKQQVDYTRTTDTFVTLEGRAAIENKGNYDYFISFHRNAYDKKARGVETYSIKAAGKGRELAEKIQDRLDNIFYGRGCKTANFSVLRNTKAPAVLIEIGFIDNEDDNKIFDERYIEIRDAIAEGILRQVNINMKLPEEGPTTPEGGETYYRVICGSYKERSNAEAMQNNLSAAGFNSFLEVFKK